ncbi:MAG: glutathione peroxidase [Fimbriimonadaceae bacterium]
MLLPALFAAAFVLSPGGHSIYEFKMKSIEGKEIALEKYKGKVMLMVNVASKCGNTPQYAGLEKLYKDNKDKGLVVMGFPANQFGGQEPGTDEEIKAFCTQTYGVTFPMFSKIVVKGEGIHPLFTLLTKSVEPKKEVEWNFTKFLVGRDGKVLARFDTRVQPDSEELLQAVKAALAAKAPLNQD